MESRPIPFVLYILGLLQLGDELATNLRLRFIYLDAELPFRDL